MNLDQIAQMPTNSQLLLASTTPISSHISKPQETQSLSPQNSLQPTAQNFVSNQSVSGLTAAANGVDNSNCSPMCLLKTGIASVQVGDTTIYFI